MAHDDFDQTISNAQNGGSIGAAIESKASDLNAQIVTVVADYRNHVDDFTTQASKPNVDAKEIVDSTTSEIMATAQRAESQIEVSKTEIAGAQQSVRTFRFQHSLTRNAMPVNASANIVFFSILTMAEGFLTAMFFYGGGHVPSIATALGLGLTVSGINVLVAGVLGGGFAGKFWNYGLEAHQSSPKIRQKRLAGRVGSVFLIFVIVGFLAITGIVRATGETEHISYSLIALSTAASDFHSIMLWIVGGAFAALSWRKGLSAFSDPYPGYTQETKQANDARELLDLNYEVALEDIDSLHDDAKQGLADALDFIEEQHHDLQEARQELSHHREEVLAFIPKMGCEFRAFVAEQINTHQLITGEKIDGQLKIRWGIDVNALLREVPPVPDIPASNTTDFVAELDRSNAALLQTRQAAIEKITHAYETALKTATSLQRKD